MNDRREIVNHSEIIALMALSRLAGIGDKRRARLLGAFGSARAALERPVSEWARVLGLSTAMLENARDGLDLQSAQKRWETFETRGGTAVLLHEPDCWDLLSRLDPRPPLLFVLGDPELLSRAVCVAIVGTRRPSRSWVATARRIASELAARGFCVVSGMASGIDTAAHSGALDMGGRTIAVLGSGVDVATPSSNASLHRRIEQQGAVVSELMPGTPGSIHTFPRRNRIISGLSLGTVLVEAPRASGALITARHAIQQGRKVFAVQGEIATGKSAGCHRLIREGAQLIESADEIVEALTPLLPVGVELSSVTMKAEAASSELEPNQRSILGRLEGEPSSIDELAAASPLATAELLDALSRLELAGLVDQLPGKRFCLNHTAALR